MLELHRAAVNIPVANWATQMTSTVASALAAHPEINYIAPVFDTMEAFTTPAVKAANALDKVKMVSFNASEAQMKEMQTGAKPTWVADGGYDLTWWGWLMMDDVYRIMLNKPASSGPGGPAALLHAGIGEAVQRVRVAGSVVRQPAVRQRLQEAVGHHVLALSSECDGPGSPGRRIARLTMVALSLQNASKSFGGVKVLKGVDLTLRPARSTRWSARTGRASRRW